MKLWKNYLKKFATALLHLTDEGNEENDENKAVEPETSQANEMHAAEGEGTRELVKKNQMLGEQNKKLTLELQKASDALGQARASLEETTKALKQLSEPPNSYGTILQIIEPSFDSGEENVWTADIYSGTRKMRVRIDPRLIGKDGANPKPGQEVLLSAETQNIIGVLDEESSGEIVSLKEILDDNMRAVVVGKGDDERVLDLAENLQQQSLKPGDSLLANLRSNILLERLPKLEVEELILEETPDITYENVAGLDAQIEQIKDAVELPFMHQDLFIEHQLPAPKGILLYGPPGCGKTLIAKAVANALANSLRSANAEKVNSSFINIKGPELLNKYVGETERQIRRIFQRAREKSQEGGPVIVFFDEMESLFRMRGSGISSDMESTVVPQLLAEIDGLESLKNVIVIGASNREDLIDPAILRPGRLDVKIKIERPNSEAAHSIFACYMVEDLPIAESEIQDLGGGDKAKAIQAMIEKTVEVMYSTEEENRFLEVTYANGDKEIMYFKDFASGAMIENIVRRAKKIAIKQYLETEKSENQASEKGLRLVNLLEAIDQEFREHEDLPNTTNPDDWAKISGKKGQRITFVRTLLRDESTKSIGGKSIERGKNNSGQYL